MNPFQTAGLAVNVVELNPYAPRPFVFTEAARCLHDSIRATGCASNLLVNEVDAAALSLVLGAVPPLPPLVQRLDPSMAAIVNFEQLASNSPLIGSDYQHWLRDWVVVDYHSSNIEHLQRQNGPAQLAFELPIVPGPSLAFGPEANTTKSVDVLFYGTLTERRAKVLRQLEAAGVKVEVVAGAYAQELAPALMRARLVLHVHYYDTGLFPIARVLQPVANGIPVVCESSVFSQRSDWSRSGILFADYDGLADACRSLLVAPLEAARRAEQSKAFASELDFRTPFGRMLLALARRAVGDAGPGGATSAAQRTLAHGAEDESRPLSNEEIEAILVQEAAALPPESHLPAAPITLVARQMGEGKYGRLGAWLWLVFSLFMLWQLIR